MNEITTKYINTLYDLTNDYQILHTSHQSSELECINQILEIISVHQDSKLDKETQQKFGLIRKIIHKALNNKFINTSNESCDESSISLSLIHI